MVSLAYLTSEGVRDLTDAVSIHLDWYYSLTMNDEEHPLITVEKVRYQTKIQIETLRDRLLIKKQSENDAKNALAVFETLRVLTPVQATDERLWVYLCHTECRNYVAHRWLSKEKPIDKKGQQREITHFFIPSSSKQRNLFRHNAVSRLWWMGYIADQIFPDEPDQFLEILLFRQDIANQVLTRSFTQNKRILRSIFEILKKDWHDGKGLLNRDVFREWMSQINLYGGVVLLDSLSVEHLNRKLLEFSEMALDST